MILILLILLSFQSSTALAAKTYTPKYQRRAMSRLVSEFSSSLSEAEKERFYESYLTAGRAADDEAKARAYEKIAIEVVEATGAFARAAREDRVEDVRQHLRAVMVGLVRAAGTKAVHCEDSSSMFGCGVLTMGFLGNGGVLLGGGLAGAALHSPLLHTIASYGGMGMMATFVLGVATIPVHCRLPGTTRLAHRLGLEDSMNVFWPKVGKWLASDPIFEDYKMVQSAEDFRSLLERELRGVSVEQACASALRLPPPVRRGEGE